ncbi:hypothetical protein K2173_010796 [Erythroxylum novogranatense]|uniref:Uncharacterized protein n=1 Tax=Erythroxylum novogranatense TaxID=1862640 RepID=A0AAV8SZP5_9ROSI|nr:hypothetical protein K2173_010796 [Erythroxylum novogranatense]
MHLILFGTKSLAGQNDGLSLSLDQIFCFQNFRHIFAPKGNFVNVSEDTHSYQLESSGSDKMASVLLRGDQDYMEEINELYTYIDKVKNMVIPGCSEELLKAALNSMSSLLSTISFMSSVPRLKASL